MRKLLESAANEVHNVLGSGWSESIYHRALERELSSRGLGFNSEATIPVMYKGAPVGRRRPDLFVVPDVGGKVIVELKAGSDSGRAQLDQYLELTESSEDLGDIRGGALIQFNEEMNMEFVELGPQLNADDADFTVSLIEELATGVDVYIVEAGDHAVQVNADTMNGDVFTNWDESQIAGDSEESEKIAGMAVNAVRSEVSFS